MFVPVAAALLCVAACHKTATNTTDRVAFLNLDNLTPDPSLDWIKAALPVIAASQVSGVGNILPVRGDTAAQAIEQHANHMVHGSFESRNGSIHFQFSIEDAASHSMRDVTADGNVLQAADILAKAIDPGARAFGSSNLDAVTAWGKREFDKAVQLDPDFAMAWIEQVQTLSATQPTVAVDAARKALERSSLRTPVDRARLELMVAQMAQDDAAMGKAGDALLKLLPKDNGLAKLLAQQAFASRRFSDAVRLFQTCTQIDPTDTESINLAGYSQYFAGDLDGARKSFADFRGHPDHEAQGLDSEGEVLFMAGKFKEAENLFMEAHKKKPDMLNGGDLLKAAHAHWLGGDLPGADKIFEDFVKVRSDQKDPVVDWRRAVWLFSTGRAEKAVQELEKIQGAEAQIAQQQLQLWTQTTNVDSAVEVLEPIYRKTPATADGLVRTLYARALAKAGKKDEAGKLAEIWPLPESGEPLYQAFEYPLFLELRKALGKK